MIDHNCCTRYIEFLTNEIRRNLGSILNTHLVTFFGICSCNFYTVELKSHDYSMINLLINYTPYVQFQPEHRF